MSKLALRRHTSQALGNISSSTSAVIRRNFSFLPAAAAGGDTQQGRPFTPLPQCSTSSQQGTWDLCRGTRAPGSACGPAPGFPALLSPAGPSIPCHSKLGCCPSSLSCPECLCLLEKVS